MLKIITTLSMFLVGALAQAQAAETNQVSPFSKIVVKKTVSNYYTGSPEKVTLQPEPLRAYKHQRQIINKNLNCRSQAGGFN